MRLTSEARQDVRRLVAVFGISLAFMIAQSALALSPDRRRPLLRRRAQPRPALATPTQTTTE
jgi:hypothetical protein